MESAEFYTIEGESVFSYPGLIEILKEEDMYDVFTVNRKIRMVGTYRFLDGTLWYSFPKYFHGFSGEKPAESEMEQLRTIGKVIEKLRVEGKNLFEGDHIFSGIKKNKEKRKVNIIELSRFIVKDYVQNGIFKKSITGYTKTENGRIAWQRTTLKNVPLIVGNDILYDRPWKKLGYEEKDNIISVLHAYIVSRAIIIYSRFIGGCSVLVPEYPPHMESVNLHKYVGVLNKELLATFSDRESVLIKALIAWCDMTYNYRLAGCTNCFQNVWEWVNDSVFGNQESKQNKESQVPSYHFYDKEKNEVIYSGQGVAKPDTIYFKKAEDKCYLFVYDSKYYVAKFLGNADKCEVQGYPANSDIVKQVAYMRKIQESLVPLKVEAKNIFLLPELSEDMLVTLHQEKESRKLYTEIGYVMQADFDKMAENLVQAEKIDVALRGEKKEGDRVYLYMVYCEELYDMFLNDEKYNPVCASPEGSPYEEHMAG